ncbi:MAG: Cytochrome c oxidase subunit [Frankiales bacterium]|jgi:heme/copper-type cytochrome/quinol oxidase subunit 3|nr:Cytochrome c oxidase subunit [Frankiales bacterium]
MTTSTVSDPVHHHEERDTIGRRWRGGVILLILADAAFVASFVFAYFYLRGLNTEGVWLAKGQRIAPIWVGWVIAAILIVSAAAYRWGRVGLASGKRSRLLVGVAVALLLVIVDLVVQFVQLATLSFGAGHSAYASCIYVLGGANVFHLLLTAFLGLGVLNRGRLDKYAADNDWQVHIIGIWWSWIAVAAVITALTTSFVASPNHIHILG